MESKDTLLLLVHYASLAHDVTMNDVIGMASYLIGWSDFKPTTVKEVSEIFGELMEEGLIVRNDTGWTVSVEGFRTLFEVNFVTHKIHIDDLEKLIDWYYGVFQGPDLRLMRT